MRFEHRLMWTMVAMLGIPVIVGSLFGQPHSGARWRSRQTKKTEGAMALSLKSQAFKEGDTIPKKYTCDGADVSPPLSWEGVPDGTRSFAFIVDDPDAPRGVFTHWVLYDLPAETRDLPEGVKKNESLASGAKQGVNDFGSVGYNGPCPPPGRPHRYFFTLRALDTTSLQLPPRAKKADVERAMKGHVLGEAKLMGLYQR